MHFLKSGFESYPVGYQINWSFFRLQREAKVLGAGPDLTLGHLWPSHKQNPDPEWERIRV